MAKHKVLVFGSKTFGNRIPTIKSELFDVTFERFPEGWNEHKRISDYSIIILDYCAFQSDTSVYKEAQEIFEKELFEALDKGATVCFLHYDEEVPPYARENPRNGYMKTDSKNKLLELQIGFRFLDVLSVRPAKLDKPIHDGEIIRTEFKNFLDKWGSSKNLFMPYNDCNFDDRIQTLGEFALGFSNHFRKGLLIYLPCQRNFSNVEDIMKLLETMIDNLITYITRIHSELPDFVKEPFFEAEKIHFKELKSEEEKIKDIKEKLNPYSLAKTLAFASQYDVQKLLPRFLNEKLGLLIEQSETYNEDFWLLDSSKKRIAICEIKSYVKGFSKSGVYDIYNHREYYKLDELFPAILFVNLNLNAADWKQKLSPIAPQDYQVATSNNVLLVRVEDVLFMWDAYKENKLSRENILKLLGSNKGWLHFKSDHTYEIRE